MPNLQLSRPDPLDAYLPVDSSTIPAVDDLLRSLGLGSLLPETVRTRPGRNPLWIGTTASGARVFVKSLAGDRDDVRRRVAQTLAFETSAAADAVAHPHFLGADEENGVVAFAFLDGATGVELMVDETFGLDDADALGRLVARLHVSPVGELRSAEHPAGRFLRMAESIPLSLFEQLTSAQVHAWRLVQNDGELLAAVARHLGSTPSSVAPLHGDLRVDQLLRADGVWHLTDWEEFGAGDPAHDVGSFIGEWLNRSILDVTTTRGDTLFVDIASMTHELMMQRTAEKILRLQPIVQSFWSGYVSEGGSADDSFRHRVVAECGWHLMDRMLASAAEAPRLGAIQRAAAGLGRTMLMQPASYAEAIGLTDGAS